MSGKKSGMRNAKLGKEKLAAGQIMKKWLEKGK